MPGSAVEAPTAGRTHRAAAPSPRQRPRVVLLTEASGGGVGRHVLDLAESLPAHDFEVLLVHGTRRIADGFGARIGRADEFGYRAVALDLQRAPGVHDVAAIVRIRSIVRQFQADVLHAHSSKAGLLARLGGHGVVRSIVYTPHAFFTQNPLLSTGNRAIYGIAERVLALGADRIVTVSSEETTHALSLGIAQKKLVQIENGIENWPVLDVASRRSRLRERLGIDSAAVVVGFLGRLVEQKAPDVALRVFRRLIDDGSDAHLILTGDGPLHEQVSRLLDELALRDRVHWLRDASGRDVMPAYDVFLMTSRYEAFPYVLLEALAAGCAIVSTDVGGVADCIQDGRNGIVVRDHSDVALASAVRKIVAERDTLLAMQHRSLKLARRFSVDSMVDRTVSLYRSLDADH